MTALDLSRLIDANMTPDMRRQQRHMQSVTERNAPFGLSDLRSAILGRHQLFPVASAYNSEALRLALANHRGLRQARQAHCKGCRGIRWGVFLRDIKRNGQTDIVHRCLVCTCEIRRYGSKRFDERDIIAWPVWSDRRATMCERCGDSESGTEVHHWAPKYIFGWREADWWPTGELCRPCHRLWHDVVTPGRKDRQDDPGNDDYAWFVKRGHWQCQRCGVNDAPFVNHQWAPAELFGDEESTWWPSSRLCVDCSQKWTDKIMAARKAAAA